MLLEVKDDVLKENNFLKFYKNYILYGCNHYRHYSDPYRKDFFYAAELKDDFNTKYLTTLLFEQNQFLLKYKIERVYFNLQWPGQDGAWHTDEGDLTALYFICDKSEGGEFCIKEPEQKIEYKKDRLILFEGSKLMHKGLSFKNGPRISIAYKMNLK